jgi:Coenzyme PQQ synthesis protein D (PqqD)
MRHRVNHGQVINEVIDGEAIRINLATGNYYSLDPVGGEVWTLVEQAAPLDRIVAELGARYDGSEEEIRAAVEELLARLTTEDLVVAEPDDATPSPAAPLLTEAGTRRPFTPPTLERFTDMQDLILLDPVHEVDQRGWPHVSDGKPVAGA